MTGLITGQSDPAAPKGGAAVSPASTPGKLKPLVALTSSQFQFPLPQLILECMGGKIELVVTWLFGL